MDPNQAPNLINECKTIEENCLYTAGAHFSLERKMDIRARLFKYVPAAMSVISGGGFIANKDSSLGWLAIISGLTVALSTALEVDKKTLDHREAAKMFTMLRHKARSAYQTFVFEMSREEFAQTTKRLCEHYSELVMRYPSTTEKAFNEARKKIKTGDYEPDFSEVKQEEALLAKTTMIKGQGVPSEIDAKANE